MDAGESQELVWTYRWEVLSAPRGLAAWLVDDGGHVELAQPAYLAFQIREAAIRAFASVPRFAGAARRGDQLRFGEPPAHFLSVTGGDASLLGQEIFAFLPAAMPANERMPWFRVGRHVFFLEEEARRIARERREAAGTAVAVARAGVGGATDPGVGFLPDSGSEGPVLDPTKG